MKKIFILLILVSCSSINPQSSKVKIVSNSQLPGLTNCTEKSTIREGSEFGQDQLLISLKNKATSEGGNVLLSDMKTQRSFGFLSPTDKVSGIVYNCPDEVLNKLKDFGQW